MTRLSSLLILAAFLAGCNSRNTENKTLNIVFLGYDSVACYSGNSAAMTNIRYGSLENPKFIDTMLTMAADTKSGMIKLKPGEGAGVLGNWEFVDTLLRKNNFPNVKLDTLDERERHFFNTGSILTVLEKTQGEQFKLFLPKDDEQEADTSSHNRFVVLMLTKNEFYVYRNAEIEKGEKCTYKKLRSILHSRRSEPDFFVVLKPSEKTSYENTVDILDLMIIEKIKKYSLKNLSEEESNVINRLAEW